MACTPPPAWAEHAPPPPPLQPGGSKNFRKVFTGVESENFILVGGYIVGWEGGGGHII